MIITSKHKDKLLFYLCTEFELETFGYADTKKILNDVDLDFKTYNAIIYQFERYGFLSELGVGADNTCFIIHAELHDYAEKGGFVIQNEIFKSNIEKLSFEIENLKKQLSPNNLDTLNKISSIASALFGGLDLLPK